MGVTKLNHTTKSTHYAIYIVTLYAMAVLERKIRIRGVAIGRRILTP
ncbi:MAG: hypothetical protein QQW96_11425 [Tychonema bourrellyi B0820]|nr:hypothetical protein [Tychonema bourrellyi B0820]